ncbi:major facilitator superfamily domain-containing protein [Melampsora americana]|nr:major facilitator superfamily domain-containing protein [Melampsora americana]
MNSTRSNSQDFNSTRCLILISSIIISLSAGTNYAFSAYSAQLAQRLKLSSTTLNSIGISGNLGMYFTSPIVGQIIDRIGPQKPLLFASLSLCLAFGMLLTGIGSSTALSSAAGAAARSFHPRIRATVIGFTLAGFGLSAFFWARIGTLFFSDETESFLLLLCLGTSSFILIGFCGLSSLDSLQQEGRSNFEPLLDDEPDSSVIASSSHDHLSPSTDDQEDDHHPQEIIEELDEKVDVYGTKLMKTLDFWLLWIVMGCCCGTALMIINNLGTIIATLDFQQPSSPSDPNHSSNLAHLQSNQVSLLSIFNCLGRIFAGTISDTLEARLGLSKVWWLGWVSSLFFLSQALGYQVVKNLASISILTGLTGFAYGNMYGTGPNLMIIWFGVDHFATNFGFLNLAPVFAGQIFNLSFGQIYDAHTRINPIPNQLICMQGQSCFREAFRMTIVSCGIACFLAGVLVFRNRKGKLMNGLKKKKKEKRNLMGSHHGTSAEQTWMLSSPTLTA